MSLTLAAAAWRIRGRHEPCPHRCHLAHWRLPRASASPPSACPSAHEWPALAQPSPPLPSSLDAGGRHEHALEAIARRMGDLHEHALEAVARCTRDRDEHALAAALVAREIAMPACVDFLVFDVWRSDTSKVLAVAWRRARGLVVVRHGDEK